MVDTPYKIMITIGDPGGDGHGCWKSFHFQSSHSQKDIYRAYDESKYTLDPEFWPEKICGNWSESTIGADLFRRILDLFPVIRELYDDVETEGHENVYIDPDWLAAYNIAFWKYSLPELIMKPIDFDDVYGWGYGLLYS